MKKLIFFLSFIIVASCGNAQNSTPPPVIPPYKILTTDSVTLSRADLKKDKPTMIIYFAPDCSHCQHLTMEMKAKMASFKNIQIVMITFAVPLKATQVFYHDYGLKKYPNIIVGTEGKSYIVAKYYNITSTPYIAIYDKNGRLSKAYDKPPEIDELAEAVKKVE